MGFIHLLSLFAACHAAQAKTVEGRTNLLSGREWNKDATISAPTPITGDDGASSTHGRMLARRTTRSLVKHVHKWMKDFNPINLEPSALVYAVKWDELLGSEVKIVQWVFKILVISTAVNIFGVLACGIIWNILGLARVNYSGWLIYWIVRLYDHGGWYLAGSLTIPTLYALWAVPDQRVPYLVMLIVTWVARAFAYALWEYGADWYGGFNSIPGFVLNIISILVYGFVGWYNWYKVLFPTWTGFGAEHWPQ